MSGTKPRHVNRKLTRGRRLGSKKRESRGNFRGLRKLRPGEKRSALREKRGESRESRRLRRESKRDWRRRS